MTYRYLIPVEIDVELDEENPQLVQELVSAVLTEGFSSYQVYGDLEAIPLLDIFISPTIVVDDSLAEQREKRIARLKNFWTHVRFRRAENYVPGRQMGLPGLEAPS